MFWVLTVKLETKRNEVVGVYFSSLGNKLGKAANELEQVAKKQQAGIDKSDSSNKIIRGVVNSAKSTLSTLKEHLNSLKDIGDANKIVDVTSDQQGLVLGEFEAVKLAAINAVNKVLGILNVIITKTVSQNLEKLREAVHGIRLLRDCWSISGSWYITNKTY